MKKIFLAIVSVCLTVSLMGQNIKVEKPTVKKGNAFGQTAFPLTFSEATGRTLCS